VIWRLRASHLLWAWLLLSLGGCMVPQMAMSLRERGDSFLSHGHYDAATYHYTRAIEADANDWQSYSGRATALSHGIDLDQRAADKPGTDLASALADCDRAIALAPAKPQLYLNRGVIRAAAGQLDAALGYMERAVQLEPADGLSHGYRGFVLLLQGRDADAQAELDQCTRLNPTSRRELNGYVTRIKKRRGQTS
jgi:tetratricopeptide (TPR) repeat protein